MMLTSDDRVSVDLKPAPEDRDRLKQSRFRQATSTVHAGIHSFAGPEHCGDRVALDPERAFACELVGAYR